MKNLSFRSKITVWFAGIMAVLVAVTFGIVFWVSNFLNLRNIQGQLIELIESNVDEVEFHSEKDYDKELHGDYYISYKGGYLEIDDDFLDIANGICSSLYSDSGTLLYGVDPLAEAETEIPFTDRVVKKTKWKRKIYYVYDCLLDGYRVDGLWLRGVVSQDQGVQQLQGVIRLSLISLPALLVFAVIGGYWIAGRALRPVAQITQAAAQISQGQDLEKRIGLGEGADELHRLAKVLDDMIGRLDEAFKAEQRFTSDASHELRTPMSVIMAQCEYTLEKERTAEEYEDALKVIGRQGKKMTKLIDDMLCFARLDQNRGSYPKKEINLSQLVQDVCSDMSLLRDRNITLDWETEADIFLHGNRMLLTRMLSNLISNAYRYGKQDGRIHVALRRENGILLSVEDDGIGISEEEQTKIFERFYRAETSRSGEGTGLGLAMVKDIARYHGGTVRVTSKIGEGSVFTVSFS